MIFSIPTAGFQKLDLAKQALTEFRDPHDPSQLVLCYEFILLVFLKDESNSAKTAALTEEGSGG